jgi:hypothetical protein
MSSPASDALRAAIISPENGVVGLVDDVLGLCCKHALEIDWRPGVFRLRSNENAWEKLGDVRIAKSVFRAILARFGAMCNEHHANAVSPFGGEAEIMVSRVARTHCRVSFVNTTDEQSLKLISRGAAAKIAATAD